MSSINLTPTIFWAASSPMLTLAIILGVGIYLSKTDVVSSKDSKLLSTILINVMYPCLLFTSVIIGVDQSNLSSFGIMTLASVGITSLGMFLGMIVLKLTNPPLGFRYGTVFAVAMGNHGDAALAIVIAVGNLPPFQNGDAAKGVAYVAAFICFTNIFFFTLGFKYIGEDFKHIPVEPTQQDAIPATLTLKSETPKKSISTDPNSHNNISQEEGQASTSSTSVTIQDDTNPKPPQPISTLKYWIGVIANPNTVSVVLGLTVTMIPALRNLFYTKDVSSITVTSQPLGFMFKSFIMIGNGAVPIGLLNVGTALGRLKFAKFAPAGVIGGIAACRLLVMPVIGIATVQWLASTGVINSEDKMMRFVIMLQAIVPTASSAVYLTQFWHPRGEADAIASVVVVQYGIALVTMTFSLAVMMSLLA
ncbi:auxin efflux carrier [Obelidium mucronatum]|nr:auxin efflux carrier [Obelidium mucronatum]